MSESRKEQLAELTAQLAELTAQLADLVGELNSLDPQDSAYNGFRIKVTQTAGAISDLTRRQTDPAVEHVPSLYWLVTVKLFLEWGLLELIPTAAGSSISYGELAAAASADADVIRRMSWVLVSFGFLDQVGSDRIAHTDQSQAYLPGSDGDDSPVAAECHVLFDHLFPMLGRLPAYFAAHGRRAPTSVTRNPFTFTFGGFGSRSYWDVMNDDPVLMRRFMRSMVNLNERGAPAGTYPFADRLAPLLARAAEQPERVLLVDVGGGRGHAVRDILAKHPAIPPRRCVLQDRADVIGALEAESDRPPMQTMAVDFFQEQPVKGAAIYYLRHILHDYADAAAKLILDILVAAMAPDSRLLVSDQVLVNPPPMSAAVFNLSIMNMAGTERTRDGFDALLASAGLRILDAWPDKNSHDVILECVKADSV